MATTLPTLSEAYATHHAFVAERARFHARGCALDADDLASEAWVRITRRYAALCFDRERFDPQFRGYVRHTVRSVAIDSARQAKRRPAVSRDADAATTADATVSDPTCTSDVFDAALLMRDLLRHATPRQRRILNHLLDAGTANRARSEGHCNEVRYVAEREETTRQTVYAEIKALRSLVGQVRCGDAGALQVAA